MSDQNKYTFPSTVTISECAKILNEINNIQNDGTTVIFDASQIENVDTAGVQLIISACTQNGNRENFKEQISMSENLKASLENLGM